jgi:Rrf2 family protein
MKRADPKRAPAGRSLLTACRRATRGKSRRQIFPDSIRAGRGAQGSYLLSPKSLDREKGLVIFVPAHPNMGPLMIAKTTRYALWVLVALAKSPEDGGYLRAHELARRLGIPGPYLSKVLYTLSQNGLVESVRGRTGGYRLRRRPERVTVKSLVGIFEPEALTHVCIIGNPECPGASCRRHRNWQGVQETFLSAMEETTIADIS